MNLFDRMKEYYEKASSVRLVRRMPVIIRVDGKAFHTLLKNRKSFDNHFMNSMVSAATLTMHNIQGCKLAYVQSDEASFFLTDYDDLYTEAWFGYVKSKIESVSASLMTYYFNKKYCLRLPALFDSRSFNIPKEEIVNYFVWRAKDWERNSLSMYCREFFSHRKMMNKNTSKQHEMLHSIGKNWSTDLSSREKNGTFIVEDLSYKYVLPSYNDIKELINESYL